MLPMPGSSETDAVADASFEALHHLGSHLVVNSLLPAICVAWADGTVSTSEREQILHFADQLGISTIPGGMKQLEDWLHTPPTTAEIQAVLDALRVSWKDPQQVGPDADDAMFWAQAVAWADGGILGFGSVSASEKSRLTQLGQALDGTTESRLSNGLLLAHFAAALMRSRRVSETPYVDHTAKLPHSPMPMPSPIARMPPAILHVPQADADAYKEHVLARYLRTVREDWWETAHFACSNPGVAAMSDTELHRLIFDTPFSRFVVPTLDAIDRQRFAAVLKEEDGRQWAKVDFSHLDSWRPLEGIVLAPTVGLVDLQAIDAGVRAIAVRDQVYRPVGSGPQWEEAWSRARYFLLQGASNALVVGIHPLLHFPHDSVIAVTRQVLPEDHRVRRLVEAHAYLHLPVNHGVQWNRRSAARNPQSEVYTPFPADWVSVFRSIGDYYSGLEGNSAYPGFRYPMSSPDVFGRYGDFLRDYYAVILAHCTRVAEAGPIDPELRRWASILSNTLPGFPGPDALHTDRGLARALAGFVHAVVVWHSAEHHAYGQEPVNRVPLRLRIDAPTGADAPTDRHTWLDAVDLARQELARRMFFKDHPVRTILDVQYHFSEATLKDAETRFFAELKACAAQQVHPFIPLEEMACSIQY